MRPQESINDYNATDADWRLWCRLCAKEDPQNNINIFFKEESLFGSATNGNDLSLLDAIKKYFWVNITNIDEMPKMLCTECFSRVTSMVNFSERVSKVQQMFSALQSSHINTKLYLQSLRLKYGILDEESEQVIQRQLPEVHYVEEKPIIDELVENIFKAETTAKNPLEPTRVLDKEKENYEDVSNLDDKDFGNETGSERDCLDDEGFVQNIFEKSTMKRKQRITVPVSQQKPKDEKPTTTSKKPKNKPKRKTKRTKRNDTSLDKSPENTKDTKAVDVEKLAAPTNNWINFEDETETESDGDDDEDFVPPKYIEEADKETDKKADTANSQKEVKARKRTKKTKGSTVCDVCKKNFPSPSALRKHRETHDPNKHTCPECGLQLNTRATFKNHMLVHSAEMKYKCDFCGRPFKRRDTMIMHRRLHSGLKPYLCEFCGRTFPTSVNCRTHKTLAHRKELAAIEASSENKTIQNEGNQPTQVEKSQISM